MRIMGQKQLMRKDRRIVLEKVMLLKSRRQIVMRVVRMPKKERRTCLVLTVGVMRVILLLR